MKYLKAFFKHLCSLVTDGDLAYRKAPSIHSLEHLRSNELTQCSSKSPGFDYYVPARPEGYSSLRHRIKVAWEVFTGRADAVRWPQNQ